MWGKGIWQYKEAYQFYLPRETQEWTAIDWKSLTSIDFKPKKIIIIRGATNEDLKVHNMGNAGTFVFTWDNSRPVIRSKQFSLAISLKRKRRKIKKKGSLKKKKKSSDLWRFLIGQNFFYFYSHFSLPITIFSLDVFRLRRIGFLFFSNWQSKL